MTKIGINGFGRIGRLFLRSLFQKKTDFQVVSINDPLLDLNQMAYLFKFDTVHGRFKGDVKVEGNFLIINNTRIKIHRERDPVRIPWKADGVQVVIEATGIFTTLEQAKKHITAGASQVLITAPSVDAPLFVMGVNEENWKNQDIISLSGSTATSVLPILALLNEKIGVEEAYITSIHALTRSQNTVDGPMKPGTNEIRKGRSAYNVIPSPLNISKDVEKLIPKLKGRVDGMEFRVPLVDVSSFDITVKLKEKKSKNEIEKILRDASKEKRYKRIINFSTEDLVSSDLLNEHYSFTYDSKASLFLENGNLVKLIGWFDNEIGYVNRIIDFVEFIRRSK